ncbi:folate transporter 1, chloroplastic-like [Cajanus cajan]|uniref:folate transporter 1, chloroplastic-like n=1 Tax=Cajanus cajan TaxID=3821 RepID=UPI0010FBA11B|nr:folate transporter 1, chloroplastic-like [Cajanus cajan]
MCFCVIPFHCSYDKAKKRYARNRDGKLSPGLHLASAAEAGALVSLCTNPVWLVKTRLQLQTPLHQRRPYSGIYDAFRTIMREEGFSALYRGIVPGLFLVCCWFLLFYLSILHLNFNQIKYNV